MIYVVGAFCAVVPNTRPPTFHVFRILGRMTKKQTHTEGSYRVGSVLRSRITCSGQIARHLREHGKFMRWPEKGNHIYEIALQIQTTSFPLRDGAG